MSAIAGMKKRPRDLVPQPCDRSTRDKGRDTPKELLSRPPNGYSPAWRPRLLLTESLFMRAIAGFSCHAAGGSPWRRARRGGDVPRPPTSGIYFRQRGTISGNARRARSARMSALTAHRRPFRLSLRSWRNTTTSQITIRLTDRRRSLPARPVLVLSFPVLEFCLREVGH